MINDSYQGKPVGHSFQLGLIAHHSHVPSFPAMANLAAEEMSDCFGTNGTDCPARCGWLKDVPCRSEIPLTRVFERGGLTMLDLSMSMHCTVPIKYSN